MTLASLLLVILAAFIHATWNLLAKCAAPVGPVFVFYNHIIGAMIYAPWALYVAASGRIDWSVQGVVFILLSTLIHLAYSLCLQRGYQVADLSVVYPVARGTGPMLSTMGAFLLLGETPSALGLLGMALVIAGIALIATRGDISAFRRPEGQAGVGWGAATGGLIASYTVVDAYAVRVLGIAPVLLDWISNTLRVVLLLPVALRSGRRGLEAMRGHWWIALGVGALSPLSYILVLTALTQGAPLSIVAPMREMSMMIGALLGMVVLRETVGPWRLLGCAILIAGVILLSQA
ncbi:MAG TPA: DMT family transporter [Mesorhizobium sp.]